MGDREVQDWTPMVIRKTAAQKEKDGVHIPKPKEKRFNAGKNSQTGPLPPKRCDDSDGFDAPKKPAKEVNPDLKQEIIDARLEKGWTQKELATHASVTQAVVKDIESGKMPIPADLAKIGRALGKVFKKNKA